MGDQPGELAAYLADRDVPCPGCGYNLRGNTTGECPECGADVTLGAIGFQGSTLGEHLAHRDEPCPACRYNLRGLETNRCPECGARITLSVLGFVVVLQGADRFIIRWCAGVASGACAVITLVVLVRVGLAALIPLGPCLAFGIAAARAERVQMWMVESHTRRTLVLAVVFGGAGIALATLMVMF